MESGFPVDTLMLLGGGLLAAGLAARHLTERFRLPGLLLFLALGMAVSDDGLALVRFDDAALTQNVAVVALVVILLDGGLRTSRGAIRRAAAPAAMLATLGVLVTGAVVAAAAYFLLQLPLGTALLVGAVMASTDAAAVFASMRREQLPPRLRDVLQIEAGANDPVAVLLVVGLVEVWRGDAGPGDWVVFGLTQLGVGLVVGAGVGIASLALVRRLRLAGDPSSGLLVIAMGALAYGAAALVGGSGFLAVYVAGLVLARDSRLVAGFRGFVEAAASGAEAVLFLLLGLLVFPSQLPGALGAALLLTGVLVAVARPLAVLSCLPWFGFPANQQAVVAWAGLRGAVPIVLATLPLTAGHPDGERILNVAFVTVVASVALQGPTLSRLARRLGVLDPRPPPVAVEVLPIDDLDADVVELALEESSPLCGLALRDDPPPAPARIAVVVRGETTFVPDGGTVLGPGDLLVLVTEAGADLTDLRMWATGRSTDDPNGFDQGPT